MIRLIPGAVLLLSVMGVNAQGTTTYDATVTPPVTTTITPSTVTPDNTIVTPGTTTTVTTPVPITTAPSTTTSSTLVTTPPPPVDTTTSVTTVATPPLQYACAGTTPAWSMTLSKDLITYSIGKNNMVNIKPVTPISPMGDTTGNLEVFSTTSNDGKPVMILVKKSSGSCTLATGETNQYEAFVVLPDRVVTGCCNPKV